MARWARLGALSVLLGLSACGDGRGEHDPPRGDATSAEPTVDAAAAPDAGSVVHPTPPSGRPAPDAGGVAPPLDDPNMTQDRCLGDGRCDPAHLPDQPELPFLEDMGDGWKRLVEAEWELAPDSEGYRCKTFTVPEDVYVTAFFPQAPLGTHHATYGVSLTPSGPDEVFACGVGNAGERRLQGSGVGSEPSTLPEGVAMPLHHGEQIFMNLHLFNVSDEVLRGRSGMWIKTVPEADVVNEAEVVLAGPLALDIPVGRSTQGGYCTLRSDATIYGLGPHMHQKGVHLRASAETAGGELELYDGDYDFDHQLAYGIDAVQLHAGDRIHVECTYENDTPQALHWGDSSLDEMCFVGLGLYPAIGYGSMPCSN